MRLVDRLLAGELQAPLRSNLFAEGLRATRAALIQQLEQAQVIIADNVAEYVYVDYPADEFELDKDVPSLAPPFPLFWVEVRRPSRVVTSKGPAPATHFPSQWGVLFQAADGEMLKEQMPRETVLAEAEALHSRWALARDGVRKKLAENPGFTLWAALSPDEEDLVRQVQLLGLLGEQVIPEFAPWTEELKWLVKADLYVERDKDLPRSYATWEVGVASDGRMIGSPRFAMATVPEGDKQFKAVSSIYGLFFAPMLAVSFMHCRNVEVVMNEPPPKLSRAHAKRHGRPLVRFHTLNIVPMREVLKYEGKSEETGLKRALHICRGHFKDYRQQGLFGRHHGLYWWHPHVRGSATEGLVFKDYNVHPVETSPAQK